MNPRCPGALALAVVLLLGCGPVEYLNQVNGRATLALAQARRYGAEQHAVYEYTAASEYLRKAREEAGHASYQDAIEYGRKAEELARRAESIARERAMRPRDGAAGPAARDGGS